METEQGEFNPSWALEHLNPKPLKVFKVQDIVDKYLLSGRYTKLTYSTKQRYLSAIKTAFSVQLYNNRKIDSYYVNKIDHAMVDYLHQVLSFLYKPASIKFIFSVLSNVWEYGLRVGTVAYNPWAKNQVSVKNQRDITWSKDEIFKAHEKASELGYNVLALYIILAYETGQRPWRDLRDLTWDNIKETQDGLILDFVISKTQIPIKIPLSDKAKDCLSKMERTGQYVFGEKGKYKQRRISPQGLHRQFIEVKASANIPKELQFRDLRRTLFTELTQAGATNEELRSIGGWTSDAVIHRYSRIRLDTAKNAMKKRAEYEKNG